MTAAGTRRRDISIDPAFRLELPGPAPSVRGLCIRLDQGTKTALKRVNLPPMSFIDFLKEGAELPGSPRDWRAGCRSRLGRACGLQPKEYYYHAASEQQRRGHDCQVVTHRLAPPRLFESFTVVYPRPAGGFLSYLKTTGRDHNTVPKWVHSSSIARTPAVLCESASNFDPSPFIVQVFGTVSEFAVFVESNRRPRVTPRFSSKQVAGQGLALMPLGVTVRRRFTRWNCISAARSA